MPELKAPPMPSWHGTPADLVQNFVEFVRHGSRARTERLCQELRSEIDDLEYRTRRCGERLRSNRRKLKAQRTHLAELNETLASFDDLSYCDEGLIKLIDHPSVIGIRADSGGRLIVHLRLFKPEMEGERAYIGDFEASLLISTLSYNGESLAVSQTDEPDSANWSRAFEEPSFEDGVVYGKLDFYQDKILTGLLGKGQLPELIDVIAERLVNDSTAKRRFRTDDAPSAPVWSGITTGLEELMERTIDASIRRYIREDIATAERSIQDHVQSMASDASTIRSNGLRLTRLRSELSELERAATSDAFDEESARAQLRYITSLSGVMGVQFTTMSGELVPVLHVRASTIYEDERYDLGDYEIVFMEYSSYSVEGAAVVRVNQTRKPRRHSGLYYHPGGSYGSARHNWFCFGNRASNLRELFLGGKFDEFAHLAINSLNSVNSGDRYNIPSYFERIPMDATWTPPLKAARPRRRRRLSEVFSALA